MVGNFEIKPVIVNIDGFVYTVQGYTERLDGNRYATATVLSRSGRQTTVRDWYTRRLLMDKLSKQKKRRKRH